MKEDNKKERPLSERESSVLRVLVHEYINSGKPIGSRSFVIKYSLSISPATMRNTMYDLVALGYLKQPHTSAGRYPTDKGYRFYVDSLLDAYEFSLKEKPAIKDDAIRKEVHLDRMFFSITRMLSNTSKYAGVVLTPTPDYAVVKHVELVPLGENNILFVLVTRMGVILNKKVTISTGFSHDDLYRFSKYLTSELAGYSLFDIKKEVFDHLRNEEVHNTDNQLALDIAELALSKEETADLFVEGIENLLHIPDMIEQERLNTLLHLLEDKTKLKDIMEKNIEKDGVNTLIGGEIEGEEITGCSIVASSYKIGSKKVGAVGVLGPTRMDYEKVVPLVDYTGRVVSDFLTKMAE